MRGIEIFQKPSYREIRPMRDRPMRGPPVHIKLNFKAVPTALIAKLSTGGPRIGRPRIGRISL